MDPHRSPDWKRIAFEREADVADLTEEIAAVRRLLRIQKLQSWGRVLLFSTLSMVGIFGAGIFVGSYPPDPFATRAPVPAPPCVDSVTVLDYTNVSISRCPAGAAMSTEKISCRDQGDFFTSDVYLVVRCTCGAEH